MRKILLVLNPVHLLALEFKIKEFEQNDPRAQDYAAVITGQSGKHACYVNDGRYYIGTKTTTKNGHTCQNWVKTPIHRNFQNVQNSISFHMSKDRSWDHNYCRNPDNDPNGPWCMTTDPFVRYDYCTQKDELEKCPTKNKNEQGEREDCKLFDEGYRYAGEISQTKNGAACIKWQDMPDNIKNYYGSMFPADNEQNFCRNIDGDEKGPWCYTGLGTKTWDYCDIKKCASAAENNNSGSGNSQTVTSGNEMQCGLRCKTDKCDPSKQGNNNNIIGGVDARNGEFPWQVQLRLDWGFGYCGGSILNKRWVLTAAHCIAKDGITKAKKDINVAVGFTYQRGHRDQFNRYWYGSTYDLRYEPQAYHDGRDIYKTLGVYRHDKYDNARHIQYDIALILLDRDIHYGNEKYTWSRPACLPHRQSFHPKQLHGKTEGIDRMSNGKLIEMGNCLISGWGKTDDPGLNRYNNGREYFAENSGTHLQWIKQDVLATGKCQWKANMLKETQICVNRATDENEKFTGPCYGDSGGPLTCTPQGTNFETPDANGHVKNVLFGVTSYVNAYACGNFNSVYSRTTGYENWIQHVIKQENRKYGLVNTLQYMDSHGKRFYWSSDGRVNDGSEYNPNISTNERSGTGSLPSLGYEE